MTSIEVGDVIVIDILGSKHYAEVTKIAQLKGGDVIHFKRLLGGMTGSTPLRLCKKAKSRNEIELIAEELGIHHSLAIYIWTLEQRLVALQKELDSKS